MKFEELKEITLDGYYQCGEGNTAIVYKNDENPDVLLKLFHPDVDFSVAEKEYEQSVHVLQLGLPTPEAYGMVRYKNQVGVLFRRIAHKVSFSRAIGEHPERQEELMKQFTEEAKKLMATECDTSYFPNQHVRFANIISRATFLSEQEKGWALDILHSLPQKTTCVHADLHTGNIVLEGDKPLWIDLGTFGYGNELIDVGVMVFLMTFACQLDFVREGFHMTEQQMRDCWKYFVKYYKGYTDPKDVEAYADEVRPYSIFFVLQTIVEFGIKAEGIKIYVKEMCKKWADAHNLA